MMYLESLGLLNPMMDLKSLGLLNKVDWTYAKDNGLRVNLTYE